MYWCVNVSSNCRPVSTGHTSNIRQACSFYCEYVCPIRTSTLQCVKWEKRRRRSFIFTDAPRQQQKQPRPSLNLERSQLPVGICVSISRFCDPLQNFNCGLYHLSKSKQEKERSGFSLFAFLINRLCRLMMATSRSKVDNWPLGTSCVWCCCCLLLANTNNQYDLSIPDIILILMLHYITSSLWLLQQQ